MQTEAQHNVGHQASIRAVKPDIQLDTARNKAILHFREAACLLTVGEDIWAQIWEMRVGQLPPNLKTSNLFWVAFHQ